MTMQPGEMLLTGQVDGRQLGNFIFSLLPALPGEGPPGMPRFLSRQMFPGGFQPFRAAPTMAPVQPIPPAVTAAPPVVPAVDANGNQILRRQPLPAAPPAPRKRVLERGTFTEWH